MALVEAAELFNTTQFRRTIAGVAKALGEPQASIMPLSGVNAEMVLTFAWDITGTSTASRRSPRSPCAWPSAARTSTISTRATSTGTPR